ncbi:MAG: PilZ domain-containing protein [Sphingomonas sp.]
MAARLSRYRTAAPALLERRAESRHCVTVKRASVRRHGTSTVDAELHDLSIYGCRLASPGDHDEGERVWLRLAGGMPIAAAIVWNRDGFVGCRFDAPIARATVRALTLGLASV